MKIYFSCSTKEFEKYKDNYYAIRKFLIQEGHILTRDWLLNLQKHKDLAEKEHGSKKIYQETIRDFSQAEVLIAEDTVGSFTNGYLTTLAMIRNLPILVLWHKSKQKYFQSSFMEGMDYKYLEIQEYTESNYQTVIRTFLKKYQNNRSKHHFHLVIDEPERRYLDWRQYQSGKSRTEIVRAGIAKLLKNDKSYQRYLRE